MSFQPPPVETASIAGPAGALEALIEDPTARGAAPVEYPGRYAVVCHPHPLHGGALTNKVVHTVARSFQELGIPTIRFNFRGVGASAGIHDHGRGEIDDALAAIAWGAGRWPAARPWLAGFSFGAFIAASAATAVDTERLVTVAPPVARFDFAAIRTPRCPWLVLQGDEDELVEIADVRRWVSELRPSPTLVVLPGVGHFFHGHLHELKAAILAEARAR
jgi:alpha/beta superfamily hydrolase